MKALALLMIIATGVLVGMRLGGGTSGIPELDLAVTHLLAALGIGK